MALRMSIDIGGTFTDLVIVDEKGEISAFKAPSTPKNFADGVFSALQVAGEAFGKPLNKLLEDCSSFTGGSLVHGSTIATNAILEGKVAKTGAIFTEGHRDILLIREGGGKPGPFEWHIDYPEPYIPRYLTMTVKERINSEGEVGVPLDEDGVRRAVRELKKYGVEAIAICFLWSIVNPVHELRAGEIIKGEWPEVHCVLSHKVNPIIREYRRASGTCVDASLGPIVTRYIIDFDKRLRNNGYKGSLSWVTAAGGLMTSDELGARPIYSVDSGPAMAPIAGRYLGTEELGENDVITVDMGGTSFDVSLVTKGEVAVSREALIETFTLGISRVDTKSVGAGGGSIAWLDPGGLLHVGPQSAGADPGPACYLRGGTEPTVTDANVILGYLDPEYILGGRMKIDPKVSEEVIGKLAKQLKLGIPEAAFTLLTTVNHNMVTAITDITVWQGIDPREYLLISGGAASGMHIVPIARELGIKRVLVPRTAGVLCAFGGAIADVTADFSGSFFIESTRFDYDKVNALLENLEGQCVAFLDRVGVPQKDREIRFFVEARYPYQIWEISVPLRSNRIRSKMELTALVEDFHDVHERIFAIKEPGQYIECVYWRAVAIGRTPGLAMRQEEYGGENPSDALVGTRKAYFHDLGGYVDTKIYRANKLRYGNKVTSPAIIEEETTTIVVFTGAEATVTKLGSYLLEIGTG